MAAPSTIETSAVSKPRSNFKPFRWAYGEERVLRDLLFVENEPRLDLTETGTHHACIVGDKWANGVGSTLREEQY